MEVTRNFTVGEVLDFCHDNPDFLVNFTIEGSGPWRGDGYLPCLYIDRDVFGDREADSNFKTTAGDLGAALTNLVETGARDYNDEPIFFSRVDNLHFEQAERQYSGEYSQWPSLTRFYTGIMTYYNMKELGLIV